MINLIQSIQDFVAFVQSLIKGFQSFLVDASRFMGWLGGPALIIIIITIAVLSLSRRG